VNRLRAPPIALFGALSFVLHAAVFAVLGRAASAGAHFDPSAQTIAGETLDVEPEQPSSADDDADETPARTREALEREPAPAPSLRSARGARSHPSPAAAPPAAQAAPRPALFGAVGVRYAADLATSFTRAFPQAASADPIWAGASLGSAGVAEVSLWLDESGRLTATSIDGAPSVALRRGVERTIVLLGSRPFTSRGALSRLRLRAWITRDNLHDGLHGDVFALSGGSFSGDTGLAFFALPADGPGPGRRVDVELRLLP